MPNHSLYNKHYHIPDNIKDFLKDKTKGNEGAIMASNLIERGYITYQHIKKLLSKELKEFQTDWTIFKNWCEVVLDKSRDNVLSSKKTRDEAGFDNSFRKEHEKSINESKVMKQAAIGFIINDGKVLLLKRSSNDEWMPNKWGCVGGGMETNETPEEAFKRETMEETTLLVSSLKLCFQTIMDNTLVHFFISTVFNPDRVSINEEHIEYKWFSVSEIRELEDTIPNLFLELKKCLS